MANAIIEEVKQTENAGLFTIRFEGQTETEFEKFKVIQDQHFMSDYDRYLLEIERHIKEERSDSKT